MCHVCDSLAPHLRTKYPPDRHPHVYECHYTAALPADPKSVTSVTDKGALDYLSGGANPWCERMQITHPDDPSGIHGCADVLRLKAPFGSGYFVPQVTTGNGNCLVHAASRGIYGVEMWHVEFRKAMTKDFDDNKDWYISMLMISDNRDRDSATALFMHARDECQSSGSYLGLIHVVALAHALRRTVIMMDRGDEMTDCAFGYHASSGTFTPFRGLSADEVVDAVCMARPGTAVAVLVVMQKLIKKALADAAAGRDVKPINMQAQAFVKRCGAPLTSMPHVLSLFQLAGFVVDFKTSHLTCESSEAVQASLKRVLGVVTAAVAEGEARVEAATKRAADPTSRLCDRRPLVLAWSSKAHNHFVPLVPIDSLEAPVFPTRPPPSFAARLAEKGLQDPFCQFRFIDTLCVVKGGRSVWRSETIVKPDFVEEVYTALAQYDKQRQRSTAAASPPRGTSGRPSAAEEMMALLLTAGLLGTMGGAASPSLRSRSAGRAAGRGAGAGAGAGHAGGAASRPGAGGLGMGLGSLSDAEIDALAEQLVSASPTRRTHRGGRANASGPQASAPGAQATRSGTGTGTAGFGGVDASTMASDAELLRLLTNMAMQGAGGGDVGNHDPDAAGAASGGAKPGFGNASARQVGASEYKSSADAYAGGPASGGTGAGAGASVRHGAAPAQSGSAATGSGAGAGVGHRTFAAGSVAGATATGHDGLATSESSSMQAAHDQQAGAGSGDRMSTSTGGGHADRAPAAGSGAASATAATPASSSNGAATPGQGT